MACVNQVILPAQYYKTHFFEMIHFVEDHYSFLLKPREIQFISDLKKISESAQCVFVRMVNRKGSIFDKKSFEKYGEIENLDQAFVELQSQGFIRTLTEEDRPGLISFLTKAQLLKWLKTNHIAAPKSAGREELVEIALAQMSNLSLEIFSSMDLYVQRKTDVLEYLMFLFFGTIQKNLTLYTLRDLGIRQSQTLKTKFSPRFTTQAQAEAEYFFAKTLKSDWHLESEDRIESLLSKALAFENLDRSTQNLKDDFLDQLGDFWAEEQPAKALQSWSLSQAAKAREKSARLFYKLDQKEKCIQLLEEIQHSPRGDEELLFAEDFYLRKFNKKRKSNLTDILDQSREISLSDAFLKRPELGVCNYLEAQGLKASFSENNLWNSLFGVLFWDELFESEDARIHNPFERSPSDLVGPEFYQNHQQKIEEKLSRLSRSHEAQKIILKVVANHYGKLNDLFRWHEELGLNLISFIRKSEQNDLAKVLRTLAQNYQTHHVGFPDIMVEHDTHIRFIEVKAEGDSLRAGQLSRLRLLKEAGFEVEVLRVRWQTDPNQVYVVVDVETTGGSANFHRVTEIGAVKIQNGLIIDEFQSLINPGRPIPAFITGLTGITNEMVETAPSFSDIAEKFHDFLKGAIFVAHNVKFDYSFIQREFQKAGFDFVRPQLCTCAGLRKAHPGLSSYGLKNLSQHFQIQLDQHHRALSDARAAAQLLLIMNEKRQLATEASIEP